MSGVARLVESVEKIRDKNLYAIDLNKLMYFVFFFTIIRSDSDESAISAVKSCLMFSSGWKPFSAW